MARRRLDEQEIEKAANKEWKQTPIFTSSEKLAYRARNLTGPKTPEGKAKALQNLRAGRNKGEGRPMTHGGYIKRLLDEDEQELYESRKAAYLFDYGDFNNSADEILLHMILIDEIRVYRMMRRQFENPSIEIDRPLNEVSASLGKKLEELGALRKQRLKQDEKLTAISIATIAQQFNKQLNAGEIASMLAEQQEEEKAFLANKEKREREAQTYEADYEVVVPEDDDLSDNE